MKIIKNIIFITLVSLFCLNVVFILLNFYSYYLNFKSTSYLQTNCNKAINYSVKSIKLNSTISNNYFNISYCLVKNNSYNTDLLAFDFLGLGYNVQPNDIKYIRDSLSLYTYFLSKNYYNSINSKTYNKNIYNCSTCFLNKLKKDYSNNLGLLVDIYKLEKDLNLNDELKTTTNMIKKIRPDILNWHSDIIN